ncbi:hypothetical protein [Muricoccus aerilatus]|uniref:hypothetical protein n=1 Tax=Muricoccus aerilatus TaxID=452982 RepID=UPI0005C22E76|nr:hypothetical protein [Roseomonas aerilata]
MKALHFVIPAAAVLFGLGGTALAQAPAVNPGAPAPECRARVNFDRNADLPGYLAQEGGQAVCIPFMPTAQLAPSGFSGDYYVQEFTDARIRARWAECRANPACADPARTGAATFTAAERRRTGTVDPQGRVDPQGEVDLRAIRRPGYFARFGEPIAAAEPRAWTVEFTVPRDSYERRHLNLDAPIRLRGWYLEGSGIEDGAGGRRRALVILNNGGGGEITGIDDPAATGVVRTAAGDFVAAAETGTSEQPGMRHWRGFAAALNAAGLDVLVTDRRGNGISGGVSGYNTAEQARDMFRMLDALETGKDLRLLSPGGELLSGEAARGRLLAGQRATEIPVVLGGYSRGSYATAWAMQQNFVADCDRDLPDGACRPPLDRTNIRGAILYGPNSGGLGWRVAGHDMVEAALRVERNTTYYPDGDVLAGVERWPALLIVKGTWDYVEGLEGSFSVLRRARGLRDILVFRGPHPLQTQHEENMRLVGLRMATFARAAVLGQRSVEGAHEPADLRALVLSSPPYWEATTPPGR